VVDSLERPTPSAPVRTSPLAFLRNTWRGLTSMRTALILLFLLALAALPGACCRSARSTSGSSTSTSPTIRGSRR